VSSTADLTAANAKSVQKTTKMSWVSTAASESETARIAESDTTAFACQPTRSSAVGRMSSVEANTQSSTNAGTTAPWPCTMSRNLPGRNGFHSDTAHAETMPAPSRKMSVWLM
jgi:hypothetical protein